MPLVVARNVLGCDYPLCCVPPVCHCEQLRTCEPSTLMPNPCEQTIRDCRRVDIMDLPKTESGNKYVVVFQDFLTKSL